MTLVRLQHGLGDLFAGWLGQHFPDRKDKVLGRIRELHGGQLNDSRFGVRMTGEGRLAETIRQLFHLGCRRAGLATHGPGLSAAHFRPPRGPQPLLFDLDG
jgi:DNA repair photolyase